MHLTHQQQAILNTNEDIVINAVAGSGKTTTLMEYARTRPPGSRILYLAFNKSVKAEAAHKFAGLKNVQVETAHSLAFDAVVKRTGYKVVAGYKSYDWPELLRIHSGDLHIDYTIASHVNKFISYFCNSTAPKVTDLNYADTVSDEKARHFVQHFYTAIEQYTRLALARMDKGEIDITHDFYLKKFQLSQPRLPYDYILFDEGQDASGAMLQVFLQQPAVKIIVGDVHQQIYGWRFATNSLQQAGFPLYPLSHSFRFDDEIALVANKVLSWKGQLGQSPAVRVIGDGRPDGAIASRATLARTNLSLLLHAIGQRQGGLRKLHFEGNISSYTFAEEGASLYDVLHLHNRKPEQVRDKLLRTLPDLKALEEYIEKTEDHSLRTIVDVVKQYGNDLPRLIGELKDGHVAEKAEAEMVFSTVHRCKGLEYDEVTLLNDFITEEKLKKGIMEAGGNSMAERDRARLAEEVNLLYVAATRARSRLLLPPELNPFRSVQFHHPAPPQPVAHKKRYAADSWSDADIEELFSRKSNRAISRGHNGASGRSVNQGKPWSREDEKELTDLYQQGASITDIAARLKRGVGGIQHKLRGMGLLDEDYFAG